jgi:hypothetical protein
MCTPVYGAGRVGGGTVEGQGVGVATFMHRAVISVTGQRTDGGLGNGRVPDGDADRQGSSCAHTPLTNSITHIRRFVNASADRIGGCLTQRVSYAPKKNANRATDWGRFSSLS